MDRERQSVASAPRVVLLAQGRAEIGIVGLDDVIGGGLARNRLHLLEGSPGTGKTTIALQFLMAGAKVGEVGIYVSLAETEQELRDGALSHGCPRLQSSSSFPPKASSMRISTRACSTRQISSLARPFNAFWRPLSGSSRSVW